MVTICFIFDSMMVSSSPARSERRDVYLVLWQIHFCDIQICLVVLFILYRLAAKTTWDGCAGRINYPNTPF